MESNHDRSAGFQLISAGLTLVIIPAINDLFGIADCHL